MYHLVFTKFEKQNILCLSHSFQAIALPILGNSYAVAHALTQNSLHFHVIGWRLRLHSYPLTSAFSCFTKLNLNYAN